MSLLPGLVASFSVFSLAMGHGGVFNYTIGNNKYDGQAYCPVSWPYSRLTFQLIVISHFGSKSSSLPSQFSDAGGLILSRMSITPGSLATAVTHWQRQTLRSMHPLPPGRTSLSATRPLDAPKISISLPKSPHPGKTSQLLLCNASVLDTTGFMAWALC